jgi:hypothetical protein
MWHIVAFWWQHFQYLLYCWQCHVSKIQRECIVMFLWQCTHTTNCVPFTFWHRCLQTFISYFLYIFEIELENSIIASVIMWKYKVQSCSYYCCIKDRALFSVDTCILNYKLLLIVQHLKLLAALAINYDGDRIGIWRSFFFSDKDGFPIHVGLFIELTWPTQPAALVHYGSCWKWRMIVVW